MKKKLGDALVPGVQDNANRGKIRVRSQVLINQVSVQEAMEELSLYANEMDADLCIDETSYGIECYVEYYRWETDEEMNKRLAEQEHRKELIERRELREYNRLKKKFGDKDVV